MLIMLFILFLLHKFWRAVGCSYLKLSQPQSFTARTLHMFIAYFIDRKDW